MLFNILTVAQQVLVLFILIAIGAFMAKLKLIHESGARVLSDIALYLATPCVIIKSFARNFDASMLQGFLTCLAAAAAIHLIGILLAVLFFHKKPDGTRQVLIFAAVFSNAGFMALPLQEAILGEVGVFYGASYIAVFNLFMWTFGLYITSGDKTLLSAKNLIKNPGILAVFVGMIIFLFNIPLPQVIYRPVEFLANLNTPIPMLVIGYYLANTNFKTAFQNKAAHLCIFLKLLVIPLISLLCMRLFQLSGDIPVSMVIAASAPVAAATTMFSAKFNRDTQLSVNMVSVSTVLSIITMPLVIACAQLL